MSDQWSTSGPPPEQPGQPPASQPYQPYPAQPYGSGPPAAGAVDHAGFWIRFAGAFIDGIILAVVQGILGAIIGDLGRLLTFALAGGYFTFFHSTKAAQTIGQRAVGIRLADADTGGGIDPGRAAIRWLMSYVSAFAVLIGYLWMLWDPQRQTWHDKVAKTFVVYTRSHPAASTSLFDR
jgi:uncharacterized RDD family membrane protein YckC